MTGWTPEARAALTAQKAAARPTDTPRAIQRRAWAEAERARWRQPTAQDLAAIRAATEATARTEAQDRLAAHAADLLNRRLATPAPSTYTSWME